MTTSINSKHKKDKLNRCLVVIQKKKIDRENVINESMKSSKKTEFTNKVNYRVTSISY